MVNSSQDGDLSQCAECEDSIGENFFVDFDGVYFFGLLMSDFVDFTIRAAANDTKVFELLADKLIDK